MCSGDMIELNVLLKLPAVELTDADYKTVHLMGNSSKTQNFLKYHFNTFKLFSKHGCKYHHYPLYVADILFVLKVKMEILVWMKQDLL